MAPLVASPMEGGKRIRGRRPHHSLTVWPQRRPFEEPGCRRGQPPKPAAPELWSHWLKLIQYLLLGVLMCAFWGRSSSADICKSFFCLFLLLWLPREESQIAFDVSAAVFNATSSCSDCVAGSSSKTLDNFRKWLFPRLSLSHSLFFFFSHSLSITVSHPRQQTIRPLRFLLMTLQPTGRSPGLFSETLRRHLAHLSVV